MKTVRVILRVIPYLILPAIVLAVWLWYTHPVHFLKKLDADEVKTIVLFDGNTGYEMELTDRSEIENVIDNIQGFTFQRVRGIDGISVVEMGYRFRLIFSDGEGSELARIIIDSDDTVRQDPFYYTIAKGDGKLCYDHLWKLIRDEFHYNY